MNNGLAFKIYIEELHGVIEKAKVVTGLESYALELEKALEKLQEVTSHLLNISKERGREIFLADATLYLEFFGIITIAWQWLLQAVPVQKALRKDNLSETDADFYQSKMYAFRYFFGYELPKVDGLATRLLNTDGLTVEAKANFF
jgi:butyryl-CoA dehydrogenase